MMDGGVFNGAVDEHFEALPPAMDKEQTSHRVCELPSQLPRRPACWLAMMRQARELGEALNVLARLDMYADVSHGPLLSEVTLLPNMGEPPTLLRHWVNDVVRCHWREPDGCARTTATRVASELPAATLRDAVCRGSHGVVFPLTAAEHLRLLDAFDLGPWGVAPGDRVALLVPSGPHAAALLLAAMNRYHVLPLDPSAPETVVRTRLSDLAARCVCAIDASTGRLGAVRQVAASAARAAGVHWVPVRLQEPTDGGGRRSFRLLLPASQPSAHEPPPDRGLDDEVLTLLTSGTTGRPKQVHFTLRRLLRSGAALAGSLELHTGDVGLNCGMPLHDVGAIACNLIAPLLSRSRMIFESVFTPAGWLRRVQLSEVGTLSTLYRPAITWCALYLRRMSVNSACSRVHL